MRLTIKNWTKRVLRKRPVYARLIKMESGDLYWSVHDQDTDEKLFDGYSSLGVSYVMNRIKYLMPRRAVLKGIKVNGE